jgi:hypothetical protein
MLLRSVRASSYVSGQGERSPATTPGVSPLRATLVALLEQVGNEGIPVRFGSTIAQLQSRLRYRRAQYVRYQHRRRLVPVQARPTIPAARYEDGKEPFGACLPGEIDRQEDSHPVFERPKRAEDKDY